MHPENEGNTYTAIVFNSENDHFVFNIYNFLILLLIHSMFLFCSQLVSQLVRFLPLMTDPHFISNKSESFVVLISLACCSFHSLLNFHVVKDASEHPLRPWNMLSVLNYFGLSTTYLTCFWQRANKLFWGPSPSAFPHHANM